MKSHFSLYPSTHWASRPIGPLYPAHKAGLAVQLPIKIQWQRKKVEIQGVKILRNEAYLPSPVNISNAPSALLKAMSPSTLLRTVNLSNGLSNDSLTFYEAIKVAFFIRGKNGNVEFHKENMAEAVSESNGGKRNGGIEEIDSY